MFREIRFQKLKKVMVNNGHKQKYVIVFLKKTEGKILLGSVQIVSEDRDFHFPMCSHC